MLCELIRLYYTFFLFVTGILSPLEKYNVVYSKKAKTDGNMQTYNNGISPPPSISRDTFTHNTFVFSKQTRPQPPLYRSDSSYSVERQKRKRMSPADYLSFVQQIPSRYGAPKSSAIYESPHHNRLLNHSTQTAVP